MDITEDTHGYTPDKNDSRKIRTARSLRAINAAVRQGFHPLLRQVTPSPDIYSKYTMMRNSRTGEVVMHVDPRDQYTRGPSWEIVFEHTYYPYHFKSPFAAYLIPKGITTGEEVLLLDLIEDYVGRIGPGDEKYRLESCTAIWNGTDLEIQYKPDRDVGYAVG